MCILQPTFLMEEEDKSDTCPPPPPHFSIFPHLVLSESPGMGQGTLSIHFTGEETETQRGLPSTAHTKQEPPSVVGGGLRSLPPLPSRLTALSPLSDREPAAPREQLHQ